MTSSTLKERYCDDSKSNIALYDFIATGLVPEFVIRLGIRGMLSQKLSELASGDPQARKLAFIEELKQSPVAVATDSANKQHYEVPASFYELVLGAQMKYSCALWKDGDTLEAAEQRMLAETCSRAQLADGQRVLDLGCGWGAFSLYAAKRFPNSTFIAISNSNSQRENIMNRAKLMGIKNLTVLTKNVAELNESFFSGADKFDRIVSVEMLEHMKNYERLLFNLSCWLKNEGKLFVHIFTHVEHPYHFDSNDENDWLTKYFFTGGTMPSHDLLSYFNNDLAIESDWKVNGKHYQKTSEAWLKNMTANKRLIMPILSETYGPEQAKRWWIYWRLFFLACAELWGYQNGDEWMVSHYLFSKVKNSV